MPRNYKSTADLQLPDPQFKSLLATKIINKLMLDGKKTTAQQIFYEAMDLAHKKLPEVENLEEIFVRAVDNVRPSVEVRSKRVGGANYQVPMQLNRRRQQSLTFRWIIEAIREERGRPMHMRLAKELMDAAKNEGKAVTTKENTHRMADANKAFAHFAW
jgi:small subunit ribosomal protein S7